MHLALGLQRLALRLASSCLRAQVLDAAVLSHERGLQPLHLWHTPGTVRYSSFFGCLQIADHVRARWNVKGSI